MVKDVVCALIVHEGKLLITQHGMHAGHPWKWEFPGGKIQPEEKPEEALTREIREELEIAVTPDTRLIPVTHAYADKEIRLHPFLCRWTGGTITLNEHHVFAWILPEEISRFDMLEADHQMLAEGDNFARLLDYARA
ncbi:MAG TPA: (deoxy)nucleoside triphosphate pyrophosphohydrolase [Prolixibacteraceae bacterium]|nr:(deoxy)nucleoside triphosphate pyrophosphohydrolase [Prolixibacteraceae bacterium]